MMKRGALLAIVATVVALVPWFSGSDALIQYGIDALLIATLAQAWNILGGFAGYCSFGNSVFYGLGNYGTAIAMQKFNWPFPAGLALGMLLGTSCAALVGLPILRLRGHYFAIATLGISATMAAIIANLDIAGRNIGITLPLVRNDKMFYESSFLLLICTTATVAWIRRSRFGAGLIAIREDEDAALVMGVNTTRYKIIALVLSAFFTTIAGGIHAYWVSFVDPTSAFDTTLNIRMVIMSMFGGAGTVFGPLAGSFLLSGIYEFLANFVSVAAAFLFGVAIVVAVVFMPRGLFDLVGGLRRVGRSYLLQNVERHRL
jgi:branched-chain amino acid transport system permease protein